MLEFFGIIWIINPDDLGLLLTIVVTMGVAFYIYNMSKEDQQKRELKKQFDILESLYTELSAVSDKGKGIKFSEGNLQWFNDALGIGKPLHSIWSIDPSPYLSNLSSKINGKKTVSLKRKIVKLNQKIEMINGIVLSAEYNRGIFGKKDTRDEVMLKFVRETINEMISLTEGMKKTIKKILK